MRIVIDNIIYSLQKSGGISVVWTKLLQKLLTERNMDIEFIEYDGAINNIFRKNLHLPHNRIKSYSNSLLNIKRYRNPNIQGNHPFIFHSSYFRTCNNPNAINISTVHDFTYEYYVKSWIKRFIHCKQKYAALRNSDYIVCISESTKKDLLHFLPDIDEKKIRVIHNGVDDTFHVLPNSNKEKNYLLYVGNRRDAYKNFKIALDVAQIMGKKLVVVGQAWDKTEQYKNNIELKQDISTEELNQLYNDAYCLLYPSEYEGFGLPILEAQKAGCPVAAIKRSSIPEIIGETPLLFDKPDASFIAESLRILDDKEQRTKIINNGLTNSKRFSWDKMTESYINLYKEALLIR